MADPATMVAVTRDDAIRFLESACRNWAHVSFDNDDLEDVRKELEWFIKQRTTPASDNQETM